MKRKTPPVRRRIGNYELFGLVTRVRYAHDKIAGSNSAKYSTAATKVGHAVIKQIQEKPWHIVYISGKSSIGKTTLSNQISRELNYYHLELDNLIDQLPAAPHIKRWFEI